VSNQRPKGLPPAPIPDETLKAMAATSFETVQGWFQNPGADGLTVFQRMVEADRKRLGQSGPVDVAVSPQATTAVIPDEPVVVPRDEIPAELRGSRFVANDGVEYEVIGRDAAGQFVLGKVEYAPGIPGPGRSSVVAGRRVTPNPDPDVIGSDHPDHAEHRDPRLARREVPYYRRNVIPDSDPTHETVVDSVRTLVVDSTDSPEQDIEAEADQRHGEAGWRTESRKARLMQSPGSGGWPDHSYD
jgi:hypothetical protein